MFYLRRVLTACCPSRGLLCDEDRDEAGGFERTVESRQVVGKAGAGRRSGDVAARRFPVGKRDRASRVAPLDMSEATGERVGAVLGAEGMQAASARSDERPQL